jgi:hypothetical protein
VELAPAVGHYWNTLGAACYRAGALKEAVAALQKAVQLHQGGISADWFFLAMAQHKLGQAKEARASYDRGVIWQRHHKAESIDLRLVRTEATVLLGIFPWKVLVSASSRGQGR